MDNNFWIFKRGELYQWSWRKRIISYHDHQSSIFPKSLRYGHRAKAWILLSCFQLKCWQSWKVKKIIIIFLILMILLWVSNLKNKSRNDLEVSILLLTPFIKSHFSRVLGKIIFYLVETFQSLHTCPELLFTFLFSQCKWE